MSKREKAWETYENIMRLAVYTRDTALLSAQLAHDKTNVQITAAYKKSWAEAWEVYQKSIMEEV